MSTPSINYYLGLITSQWQSSANFKAFTAALLQLVKDLDNCIESLNSAFDLDTAVGVQLDVLGVIVGVSRLVPFTEPYGMTPYFGFDEDDSSIGGFDHGYWEGFTAPLLDDETYRLLIRAKIGQNQWDGTQPGIYPIWQNLFPGGRIIVTDHQDMTATIYLAGTFTQIVQDLITNGLIVPRPETVQYTYQFATLPIFGFDQDSDVVAGFDVGNFSA